MLFCTRSDVYSKPAAGKQHLCLALTNSVRHSLTTYQKLGQPQISDDFALQNMLRKSIDASDPELRKEVRCACLTYPVASILTKVAHVECDYHRRQLPSSWISREVKP